MELVNTEFFFNIINANLQSAPPGAISKCAKGT
jgi:hypothetical protein